VTRRELLLAVLAVGGSSLAVACTKADEAVDPVWGKQPCAHCAMLVSDKRYAAQLVHDGDRKYFDDIGCMIGWLEERKAKPERVWVRDAEAGRWSEARSARYAHGAKTPMDFGFESRASGDVSWDEMRERVIAKKRTP
jgi:copper chaperone NosL